MSRMRRKLEVEMLEARDVPTGDLGTSLIAPIPIPPTTTVSTVPLTDPTLVPVDSGNMSMSVLVSAVGSASGGLVTSLTVSGLSTQNLQTLSPVSISLNGVTYLATVAANVDGQTTLALSQGIDAALVSVGSTITVTFGSNTTVTTSPTLLPPPPPPLPPPTILPTNPLLTPIIP